ncbi:MAG: RNA 3'-terminal phosphate cyclase [Gemmataceae bacterium]
MILLDGSYGEGGGQILRSALTLSLLTGQAFKIEQIRANRPKPGLAAQHLACVKAAATISRATYKGGHIGSETLVFEPGTVRSGDYTFPVGTAGATALVLHTVALPLALRTALNSTVTITGGTHVRAAPSYHFLEWTWAKFLAKLGIRIQMQLHRPGFYPRGGGSITAQIEPALVVRPFHSLEAPTASTAFGMSAVASLPESVAARQAEQLRRDLKQAGLESHIVEEVWDNGPGTVAAVSLRQFDPPPAFVALGEKGVPAEKVAAAAVEELGEFLAAKATVDPHMADQLVLPLALATGPSAFRTSCVTEHLITNCKTIQQFLPMQFEIDGHRGEPATVTITPATAPTAAV